MLTRKKLVFVLKTTQCVQTFLKYYLIVFTSMIHKTFSISYSDYQMHRKAMVKSQLKIDSTSMYIHRNGISHSQKASQSNKAFHDFCEWFVVSSLRLKRDVMP